MRPNDASMAWDGKQNKKEISKVWKKQLKMQTPTEKGGVWKCHNIHLYSTCLDFQAPKWLPTPHPLLLAPGFQSPEWSPGSWTPSLVSQLGAGLSFASPSVQGVRASQRTANVLHVLKIKARIQTWCISFDFHADTPGMNVSIMSGSAGMLILKVISLNL